MAKSTPNDLVAGAGWGMHFLIGVSNGLRARGWDNERIHALVTDKGKMDLERGIEGFVNALVPEDVPSHDLATGICRYAVDFEKSLEEMIAAGKYDWENHDITTAARFPISGKSTVTVDAKLFHFDRTMSSDQVERELEAAGYRAAIIAELLAFGASFPEVQRQFPVIALGSVAEVGGGRFVPCLDRGGAERNLGLCWRDFDWRDVCRFLAVRK